ncbi:YiiX/YebB-like N1pC/P60 family cysteine hydrolase [Cedecea neteri]|uniref:YiiX/YebB-like N1pC/P60 family cysteine hydrolase n=1 Tax=Cedecea neteri TaxID=158822 RepID=UPI00289D2828|nr:YiiX/YebB-like N1pC/P60 family cysteine hydrolase [Cedecea neteri]
MFLVDHNKLESGDIILTGGKSFAGALVKISTLSRFSHVMLWVDDTLIHSDRGGVYSKNPQRILFDKRSQVKVLRLRKRLKKRQQNIINHHARSLTLSVYSTIEAAAVIIPFRLPLTEGQFCSRLVAQCYDKAGISLVKNKNYCTPANFDNPNLFDEVPEAVRKATQEDIDFTKKRDVNLETQVDTIRMITEIRKIYGKKIQTLSHVVDLVSKRPETDAVITAIALRSGYFNHAEVDMEVNSWRYNEYEFYEYAREHGIPELPLAASIREIGNSSASVYKNELMKFKRLSEKHEADFFYHHVILYKRLINTDNIRKDLARNIARSIYRFVPAAFA